MTFNNHQLQHYNYNTIKTTTNLSIVHDLMRCRVRKFLWSVKRTSWSRKHTSRSSSSCSWRYNRWAGAKRGSVTTLSYTYTLVPPTMTWSVQDNNLELCVSNVDDERASRVVLSAPYCHFLCFESAAVDGAHKRVLKRALCSSLSFFNYQSALGVQAILEELCKESFPRNVVNTETHILTLLAVSSLSAVICDQFGNPFWYHRDLSAGSRICFWELPIRSHTFDCKHKLVSS